MDSTSKIYTNGSTKEILQLIPRLVIPKANSSIMNTRVVIIGGSIGGLTTAACLRAAGILNITIVERNVNAMVGAGLGLDDASIGILSGLGMCSL